MDLVDERITERIRRKKEVNLVISLIIATLGIAALHTTFFVETGISALRYLTVNGTLFTTIGSVAFAIVNVYEHVTTREVDSAAVYYLRLSCAVTEASIMVVILIQWLAGDASGLNKWVLLSMHVVIPVLTVSSFVTNDPPIGKVPALRRLGCTSFITLYAIVILCLFCSKTLPMDMIPYPFVDWRVVPAWQIACSVAVVYLIAFAIASALCRDASPIAQADTPPPVAHVAHAAPRNPYIPWTI